MIEELIQEAKDYLTVNFVITMWFAFMFTMSMVGDGRTWLELIGCILLFVGVPLMFYMTQSAKAVGILSTVDDMFGGS